MDKAKRRALATKAKVRASKFLRNVYKWKEPTSKNIGMRARTRKPCSCDMCQKQTRKPETKDADE